MFAYQHTNLFDGTHYGWACAPHAQAIFTAAINLVRWTGDRSWITRMVTQRGKGITQANAEAAVDAVRRPAGELVRDALLGFRSRLLPGTHIINSGNRDAHLECITTYAYGSAAYTAVQAWGLRHGSAFLKNDDVSAEAEQLRDAALGLFNADRGHFMCRYENGQLVPAANLYDVGMVLNALGSEVPQEVVRGIARFVRNELATETWAHCLSPLDADAVSGSRCDHQWAGCFPAWPAQFAAGLIRGGYADAWLEGWLTGISQVTRQGPFAQAYWAEDCHPPEAGAAAKCFDELSQGNHWCISSGAHYAELILDAVCGIGATDDGKLKMHKGLDNWRRVTDVRGIRTAQGVFDCVASESRRVD